MISIDDRLEYYIHGTKKVEKPTCITSGYDEPIEVDTTTYEQNFSKIHPNTEYPIDVVRYCRFAPFNTKLWFQCGDSTYTGTEWPVLVKTRDTQDPRSKGIIANLNSMRHWREIFRHDETPWNDKKPGVIWRGADTGHPHRLNFVKKFHSLYDIGFSRYVQEKKFHPDEYKDKYVMGLTTIKDMLSYKYLPVVDGNDKSSSLGWVLASNSVPIMPKPRYHSWVCEPWLKPDVHYVEVKRDWSDFSEKLEFLKKNDDFAKSVAENGTKFMLQFTTQKQELYIEQKIIEYINGL
jgi:hypothetical protein